MIFILLGLMLEPLSYESQLASKRFDIRVKAVQEISAKTDLSIVGLLLLSRNIDAQVSEFASKELELRYELYERLVLKRKLQKILNYIPHPHMYSEGWIDYYSLSNYYDKTSIRFNLDKLYSEESSVYKPYILRDFYAFGLLSLEDLIRFTVEELPNVFYVGTPTSLYYLFLDRWCDSCPKGFWPQLRHIIDNDLFFLENK